MLSAVEIRAAIEATGSERLFIGPQPDLDALIARGATSVDLRLGRWFLSFKQTMITSASPLRDDQEPSTSRTREHFVPFGQYYILHPGSFVLGCTLEWLGMPARISGYITGKSLIGRHGLVIETASGIHPGFSGCLTLELANVGEVPLRVYPGMPICQVFFHGVSSGTLSAQSERGAFSGRRRPRLRQAEPDDVFLRLRENAQRAANLTARKSAT